MGAGVACRVGVAVACRVGVMTTTGQGTVCPCVILAGTNFRHQTGKSRTLHGPASTVTDTPFLLRMIEQAPACAGAAGKRNASKSRPIIAICKSFISSILLSEFGRGQLPAPGVALGWHGQIFGEYGKRLSVATAEYWLAHDDGMAY